MKVEHPFGDPVYSHFKLSVKKKGLSLRTLMLRQIADLSSEFKLERKVELAVKSC
jgi:hypothetical protein